MSPGQNRRGGNPECDTYLVSQDRATLNGCHISRRSWNKISSTKLSIPSSHRPFRFSKFRFLWSLVDFLKIQDSPAWPACRMLLVPSQGKFAALLLARRWAVAAFPNHKGCNLNSLKYLYTPFQSAHLQRSCNVDWRRPPSYDLLTGFLRANLFCNFSGIVCRDIIVCKARRWKYCTLLERGSNFSHNNYTFFSEHYCCYQHCNDTLSMSELILIVRHSNACGRA